MGLPTIQAAEAAICQHYDKVTIIIRTFYNYRGSLGWHDAQGCRTCLHYAAGLCSARAKVGPYGVFPYCIEGARVIVGIRRGWE